MCSPHRTDHLFTKTRRADEPVTGSFPLGLKGPLSLLYFIPREAPALCRLARRISGCPVRPGPGFGKQTLKTLAVFFFRNFREPKTYACFRDTFGFQTLDDFHSAPSFCPVFASRIGPSKALFG